MGSIGNRIRVDRASFMAACAAQGQAFDQVMEMVYADCRHLLLRDAQLSLRDPDAADEAVQRTLVQTWQRCAQYEGRSELIAWMRRILQNIIIDLLRVQQRQLPIADEHGEVQTEVEQALLRSAHSTWAFDPAELASQEELMRVYEECFTRFAAADPMAANVIRWAAEDQLGIDELAQLLRRTPGATRQYLSQCRKKARVYLAPYFRLLGRH